MLVREGTKTDTTNDLMIIYLNRKTLMIFVEHELHEVIPGHFGELPTKDVFQIDQIFQCFSLSVIS
jgi:hypothetical protein